MTAIKLFNGEIVDNIEERIRNYYRNEKYKYYDKCHDESNVITRENVKAANKLDARVGEQVKINLIESQDIKIALTSIENRKLNKFTIEEWKDYKDRIKNVLRSMCSIKGVRIAVATKILHLKRPKLIPILDTKVLDYLSGKRTQNIKKEKLIMIGIQAIDKIREDIIRNEKNLNELRDSLADLPYSFTNVRLYDILIWEIAK